MGIQSMWILILGLIFGVAMSAFVFTVAILPNVAQEIRRRKLMDSSQKNTFKKLSSWEEHMLSQQKRKESLEDFWASSRREKELLRNSLSKKAWRFRTLGKIKKT